MKIQPHRALRSRTQKGQAEEAEAKTAEKKSEGRFRVSGGARPSVKSAGGSWGDEVQLGKTQLTAPAPAQIHEAEEKGNVWGKVAAGVGLAVAAIGVAGGLATPAYAADAQACYSYTGAVAEAPMTDSRSVDPVSISGSQDAVTKFNPGQQIYVQGNALTRQHMEELQDILKDNPNTYVVVVDRAGSYRRYNDDLSCGIGGSNVFKQLTHPQTGEPNGRLFQVFMDSDGGRKAFLVGSDLYDNLGVSEDSFNPGHPLFNTFLRARDQGKSLPGMVGAVIEHMNREVDTHVRDLVEGAATSISSAESWISRAESAQRSFERDFGANRVAAPNLQGWRDQTAAAKMAENSQDFRTAKDLAGSVVSNAQAYVESVNAYRSGHGDATTGISGAESAIEQAERAHRDFEREFGSGVLPAPDFSGWRAQVQAARSSLEQGNHQNSRSQSGSVLTETEAFQGRITSFRAAHAEISAQSDRAETSLNSAQDTHRTFRSEHGRGGELGSPDFNSWEKTLEQAREDADGGRFDAARQKVSQVERQVGRLLQDMQEYGRVGQLAPGLKAELDALESTVNGLSDNAAGQEARRLYDQARAAYNDFDSRYQAKDTGFSDPFGRAQTLTTEAGAKAQQSIDDATFTRNAWIVGLGTAAVALTTMGVIANMGARRRRKEAEKALSNAEADIAMRTQALVELMEKADYHSVAKYSGKTKKMADDLIDAITDALTLVGGAEKFLEEADQLVNPKSDGDMFSKENLSVGWQKVKNTFGKGNYDRAIALLEGESLDFSFKDASRAALEKGSKSESWVQELIRRGASRDFKKTLYEVLLAMADRRDTAQALLDEINEKNEEITKYLNKVEKQAEGTRDNSQKLQEKGEKDKLFIAPDVTENLMPLVLSEAEKGGLIARGHVIKKEDPVKAWDEFAAPAERMATEGQLIVDLGHYSRDNLVKSLSEADVELHKDDVKTEWAHNLEGNLSDRLNKKAVRAMRVSIADELPPIKEEADQLQKRVGTVVTQNRERTQVSPKLISGAEEAVDEARVEFHQQLQEFGVFADGTPDQVLREPNRDPSKRTQEAHTNLEAVKGQLDVGNTEQAQLHLDAVRSLSKEAHGLVTSSRSALHDYHPTLAERQKRTEAIDDSVEAKYEPTLGRIEKTYEKEVLQLVAPEVNSGKTISDDIPNANKFLGTAREQTAAAINHFDRAYLLSARDDLSAADGSLVSAQSELDSVANAETLLAKKQKAVEAELGQLDGRLSQTRSRSNARYVRTTAKRNLQAAEASTETARKAVKASPKNPYTAADALGAAESSRQRTESAISSDKQAFDSANSAISSAESEISSAEAKISWADGQSWSWSNSEGSAHESVSRSDLSGAISALNSARQYLSQAQSRMGSSQDYEGAKSAADSASSSAGSAKSKAADAVRRAESRFDSQVSDLKRRRQQRLEEERRRREAEERRRREAEEARRREEQRRRDEERRRRERNNGGGGGGWGGGGGNGSGGGSW